jgi:hypothetical protein
VHSKYAKAKVAAGPAVRGPARATGFVTIALIFIPFALDVKTFLLLGLTCIAIFASVVALFRTLVFWTQPLLVSAEAGLEILWKNKY